MIDADCSTAATQSEDEADPPDLILRDLTGSAITSLGLGPPIRSGPRHCGKRRSL